AVGRKAGDGGLGAAINFLSRCQVPDPDALAGYRTTHQGFAILGEGTREKGASGIHQSPQYLARCRLPYQNAWSAQFLPGEPLAVRRKKEAIICVQAERAAVLVVRQPAYREGLLPLKRRPG